MKWKAKDTREARGTITSKRDIGHLSAKWTPVKLYLLTMSFKERMIEHISSMFDP
jgi:hypothetical protein